MKDCERCEGSGKIADTEQGEPWPVWEALPPGSDSAVKLGLVNPIPCPDCGGTGKVDDGEIESSGEAESGAAPESVVESVPESESESESEVAPEVVPEKPAGFSAVRSPILPGEPTLTFTASDNFSDFPIRGYIRVLLSAGYAEDSDRIKSLERWLVERDIWRLNNQQHCKKPLA